MGTTSASGGARIDAYLAVVSKREVRRYQADPIPEDILDRILEAGRASGSSRNRQPWRFVVVTDRSRLRELGVAVSRPPNVAESAAAIALVLVNSKAAFDAGRTAQNMMVAGWALGVGSCPNTVMDQDLARRVLQIPQEAAVATILSLGYPAPGEPRPRPGRDPAKVLNRVSRLPLDELVHRETYRSS